MKRSNYKVREHSLANVPLLLAVGTGLFNASLDGNARRAIDLHEGGDIDEDAFKTLIRAAAALNRPSAR